ncbi:glycosyltransferase [Holophaga foetida]|uniref:glycosyltransferase n=1 Tax=Holophaga foetida TaxID=35839 RepID=UPI0002473B7B|nr:glycosyltransferase [Holophaga foetida]
MTRLLMAATIHRTLEGFLLPYAQHFRKKGWVVDALGRGTTHSQACCEGFNHCFEASWSRNPLHPDGLFGTPREIRRVVEEGNYDIVHVHTPVAAFITRLALRKLRSESLKVVYTAHGFHFHDGRNALSNLGFASMERLAGHWTDRLVVINRSDEAEALRRRIVAPSRLSYMPGIGLDLSYYAPETVPDREVLGIRRSLGLSANAPLFLMVAEFNPGKRHADALNAFAALQCPNAHLALAGQGRLQAELQAWSHKRGLSDRIHFLGYRSDIPALMKASAATLLPSEREGLPRSVMESMALGVPVIGSDARGVRDLLDACGGIKVPVGDVDGLRKAMEHVIQHPMEAARMAAGAKAKVKAYDLSALLQQHEVLYQELLKK